MEEIKLEMDSTHNNISEISYTLSDYIEYIFCNYGRLVK